MEVVLKVWLGRYESYLLESSLVRILSLHSRPPHSYRLWRGGGSGTWVQQWTEQWTKLDPLWLTLNSNVNLTRLQVIYAFERDNQNEVFLGDKNIYKKLFLSPLTNEEIPPCSREIFSWKKTVTFPAENNQPCYSFYRKYNLLIIFHVILQSVILRILHADQFSPFRWSFLLVRCIISRS